MSRLDRTVADRSVLVFDVESYAHTQRSVRFDLVVACQRITLRRRLTVCDYFVACTAGEAEVRVEHGRITTYTPGKELSVSHKHTATDEAESGASFNEVTFSSKESSAHETSFTLAEPLLAATWRGDTVVWVISRPRGPKVVRDYLLGNVRLFAECEWKRLPVVGAFRVRPSDIRMFDQNSRQLGFARSLAMRFILHQRGYVIAGQEGWHAVVKETA